MSKLSEEIKECVSCPQINGKPYGRWGTLNSQQRIKIWNLAHQCEVFESVADDSVKELTKYKRAFDILKEELEICLCKDDYGEFSNYFMNLEYFADVDATVELTQKEYELLEELMKSEI